MLLAIPASAADCATGTPWQANHIYTQGQTVVYDNRLYEALWWTQHQSPSFIDATGPWAQLAQCDLEQHNTCDLGDWSESSVYNNGQRAVYEGFSYTAQWWTRGETPGSNTTWIKGEACSVIIDVDEPCAESESVALVIDSAFATSLDTEITRLAADIKAEQNVCIKKIADTSLTTPTYIRTQLKSAFTNAGLKGAVLIGDVPGVMVGDQQFNGQLFPPSLTDNYYEVLNDAVWKDPDNNGIFNKEGPIPGEVTGQIAYHTRATSNERSIWSGRLTPPKNLTAAERVAMLRAYLDRNHDYRTGQKIYAKRMIYFNSLANNQLPNEFELDAVTYQTRASEFYRDSELYNLPESDGLLSIWNADLNAQLDLWKASVQQHYEYAYVNVHGATDFQQFGLNQNLYATDLLTHRPNVLLTDFASCNNGMYESGNYMAGYALFAGESLAVRAYTTPVMFTDRKGAGPEHTLLALGKTLGEARKMIGELDVNILFGDPTLRLRSKNETGPTVELDNAEIIFPERQAIEFPLSQLESVTLTNTGTQAIKIYRGMDQSPTWNNLGTLNRSIIDANGFGTGIDPGFSAQFQNGETLFAELAPGQSVNLPIYFYGNFSNPLPGEYTWQQVFFTNSAAQPMIVIKASQRLL